MRKSFVPKRGYVYNNQGGGQYGCIDDRPTSHSCRFINMKSGWMLIAHGVGQYDDGTIDWDYSTQIGFATEAELHRAVRILCYDKEEIK